MLLPLNASVAAPAQSAAAPVASLPAPAMVAPMTGQQIIQVLDQTLDWYRTLGIQQQAATEPGDLLILYGNRQTANQVIGLAFELARADAEILAKQPQPKDAGAAQPETQALTQLQSKFAAQGNEVQAELDADKAQLAKARPAQKSVLQAKISELQGELELINARKDLVSTMSTLSNETDMSGFGAGALKAQIDAMAVAAPSLVGATPASPQAPSTAAPGSAAPGSAPSSNPASSAALPALTGASGVTAARYGIWDRRNGRVVAPATSVTTVVPP